MNCVKSRVVLAMPVYNGDKYVREAITSILEQDHADFRLIVTDNASTDGTEDIVRTLAAEDDRITYVRNRVNLGASRNYNLGYELSDGEYLKWCAHDDLLSPNYVGDCVAALDADPDLSLAFGKTVSIDPAGRRLPPAGWESVPSLVLPVLCLALAPAAQAARLVRSGLVEMSGEEFARTARAKGISPFSVLLRHCLRPALIPLVTTIGPTAAALLTGSLVIEQIFAIPGVGMHFIQGALNRDYPLVLGAVLLYTVVLQLLTLLADLLLIALDPRLRGESR